MKQGKLIGLFLAGMAIVVLVLVFLNQGDLTEKRQLNNDAVLSILSDGQEVRAYNMSEIAALGEVTFDATLDTSDADPEAHNYTGVLLKTILEDAGLDPDGGGNAIVSAIDGYVVGVTNEKLVDDSNVYLCYMRDGQLIGTREEGGDGPYQLVISKDLFSQYWCKYVYSVELK